MARAVSLSIKRRFLSIALSLVAFFLLLNFSEPAAARPPQSHSHQVANLHAHAQPSAKFNKATTTSGRHAFKSGSLANRFMGKHPTFSTPFMWAKAAMKAFLASVWASIHSHIGESPTSGGHCS